MKITTDPTRAALGRLTEITIIFVFFFKIFSFNEKISSPLSCDETFTLPSSLLLQKATEEGLWCGRCSMSAVSVCKQGRDILKTASYRTLLKLVQSRNWTPLQFHWVCLQSVRRRGDDAELLSRKIPLFLHLTRMNITLKLTGGEWARGEGEFPVHAKHLAQGKQ